MIIVITSAVVLIAATAICVALLRSPVNPYVQDRGAIQRAVGQLQDDRDAQVRELHELGTRLHREVQRSEQRARRSLRDAEGRITTDVRERIADSQAALSSQITPIGAGLREDMRAVVQAQAAQAARADERLGQHARELHALFAAYGRALPRERA